jgi:hypothetical protein
MNGSHSHTKQETIDALYNLLGRKCAELHKLRKENSRIVDVELVEQAQHIKRLSEACEQKQLALVESRNMAKEWKAKAEGVQEAAEVLGMLQEDKDPTATEGVEQTQEALAKALETINKQHEVIDVQQEQQTALTKCVNATAMFLGMETPASPAYVEQEVEKLVDKHLHQQREIDRLRQQACSFTDMMDRWAKALDVADGESTAVVEQVLLDLLKQRDQDKLELDSMAADIVHWRGEVGKLDDLVSTLDKWKEDAHKYAKQKRELSETIMRLASMLSCSARGDLVVAAVQKLLDTDSVASGSVAIDSEEVAELRTRSINRLNMIDRLERDLRSVVEGRRLLQVKNKAISEELEQVTNDLSECRLARARQASDLDAMRTLCSCHTTEEKNDFGANAIGSISLRKQLYEVLGYLTPTSDEQMISDVNKVLQENGGLLDKVRKLEEGR